MALTATLDLMTLFEVIFATLNPHSNQELKAIHEWYVGLTKQASLCPNPNSHIQSNLATQSVHTGTNIQH